MSEELVRIVSAPIEFMGSEASSTGQKRNYRLRDLWPAGLTLDTTSANPWPDEIRISEVLVSDQNADAYPPDTRGRISIGPDPLGLYLAESNFGPVEELCWPDVTAYLGHAHFRPGVIDAWPSLRHDPEVVMRSNDLFVVAPEVAGADSRPFQCMFSLGIVSTTGGWKLWPGTVFRSKMTYDRAPVGGQKFCLRSVTPPITAGGTQIRVRLTSWASGMSPARVSIGVQSGTGPNMVAAPVPMALAGNPLITLPPHRSEDTDWADLVTAPGDRIIVNISLFSATNAWAGASRRDRTSWYVVDGQDSYASATMLGSVNVQTGATDGRTHCVDCVQVR